MSRTHGKYKPSKILTSIETYPELKRWYLNLKRGSLSTAESSIPNLLSALEKMDANPSSILKMSVKKIQDKLEELVDTMEREKYAPKYIGLAISNIKSYCRNNDIILERKIRIKNSDIAVSLEDERVPKASELDQIIAAGSSKAKLAVALIGYAGLRLEVLGNNDASDGLTLGDLPDLVIDGKDPHFKQIPARVVVRSNLSKAHHQYFSFLNQKGCDLLIDELKVRITPKDYRPNRGSGPRTVRPAEILTQKSPVILSQDRGAEGTPFITTKAIGQMIKRAISRAGFDWRPYVLRAYYDTQLLIAENNGLISRDFRVFFMGHSGDMERKYTLAKHTLPTELMKAMIQGYDRASKYLTGVEMDATETKIQTIKTMGALGNLSKEETDFIIDRITKNPSKEIQEIREEYQKVASMTLSVKNRKTGKMRDVNVDIDEKGNAYTEDSNVPILYNPMDEKTFAGNKIYLELTQDKIPWALGKGGRVSEVLKNGNVKVEFTISTDEVMKQVKKNTA